MKTELMASTKIESTNELTMIDPNRIMSMMVVRSLPEASTKSQARRTETPAMITMPQKTSNPVMMSVTESRGRNLERIPIVVFAALM